MSQIIIAQATAPTLPSLKRLFAHAVETNFTYFPPEVRSKIIRDHSLAKLFLAVVDYRRVILTARLPNGEIIGYAIGAAPVSGPAQLFWLYVKPDHRGANIGLSLLSRMLKLLNDKGAQTVTIATHDHRRYYERQGFSFLENALVHGVDMDILTFKLKT
jgi:ribosomal protein S18 acetylase RimI-like enzyme